MSALNGIARSLWPAPGDRHGPLVPMMVALGRRAVAVAAMLLGVLTGGLLALHVSVAAALAVAGAIVCAVGLAVHVASRSGGAWTQA
jgi:hypothetical protein